MTSRPLDECGSFLHYIFQIAGIIHHEMDRRGIATSGMSVLPKAPDSLGSAFSCFVLSSPDFNIPPTTGCPRKSASQIWGHRRYQLRMSNHQMRDNCAMSRLAEWYEADDRTRVRLRARRAFHAFLLCSMASYILCVHGYPSSPS